MFCFNFDWELLFLIVLYVAIIGGDKIRLIFQLLNKILISGVECAAFAAAAAAVVAGLASLGGRHHRPPPLVCKAVCGAQS